MRYRRTFAPGSAFFFTAVTFARKKIFAQEPEILLLRQAFRTVMSRHPSKIEAAVGMLGLGAEIERPEWLETSPLTQPTNSELALFVKTYRLCYSHIKRATSP